MKQERPYLMMKCSLEQYDGDVLSNIIDKVFIYNDKDIEIVFKGENFIRNAV